MARMLTGRDRRAIMLGLWVLVPALLFVASRPYRAALADTREQLATQRDLLSRELALLADLERYPSAYRTADSALRSATPRLFEEKDDVLATARLASYLAGQALASRLLFQEADPRPAQRSRDGLRTLEVDIRAEGDTEGVLRFLQSLERGPKLITIQQLRITRGERVQEKGSAPVTVLSITATVNGFALPEAVAGRASPVAALAPKGVR